MRRFFTALAVAVAILGIGPLAFGLTPGQFVVLTAQSVSSMFPPYPVYVPTSACNAVDSSGTWSGSDGTSVVQAAINKASTNNGKVILPSTPCLISSAVTVPANVTIEGQGCFENWGSVQTYGLSNIPYGVPALRGSGFVQTSPNTDIVDITASGQSVNLSKFCGQFGTPYANTGNGIATKPPIVSGQTYYDHGVIGGIWDGVKIYGHDGNHYAFHLENNLLNTYIGLRSYGGGGVDLENTGAYQYGNSVFTDIYNVVFLSGSAHAVNCGTSGQVALLYLTFIKPQSWVWTPNPAISGTSPPSSSQMDFQGYGATGTCAGGAAISPDMESNVSGSKVNWPAQWQLFNGAAMLASTATTQMNNGPSSGAAYQNLTGTTVQYQLTMQLNPGGSAATTYVYVGNCTSPCAGGIVNSSNEVGFVQSPAGATTGEQQTITFTVPPNYWMEYVATNATRVWSSNSRISGF